MRGLRKRVKPKMTESQLNLVKKAVRRKQVSSRLNRLKSSPKADLKPFHLVVSPTQVADPPVELNPGWYEIERQTMMLERGG